MFADCAGAGVICSEGEDEALERIAGFICVFVEVPSKKFDRAVEILFGVVAVADAESSRCARHELSETLRSGMTG